jgi:hypothetical protein
MMTLQIIRQQVRESYGRTMLQGRFWKDFEIFWIVMVFKDNLFRLSLKSGSPYALIFSGSQQPLDYI